MEFFALLFYFLIAVVVFYVCYLVAYIKYHKKYPKNTLKNFEYNFWVDSISEPIVSILIAGFWPIGIPCTLLIIMLKKLHKKLCVFIEKIGNKITDKDNN